MAHRLAIDVGNTRTKFGLFNNRELLHVIAIKNSDLRQNNQLFQEFDIQSIIVSSVNTEVEKQLELNKTMTSVLRLSHNTRLPIHLSYKTPETLGKDRISAVVGANALFTHKNLLVIDAGTCVTYDFLTKEKEYLGGAISPGVQMRLRSMNNFTGKLPLINWGGDKPENIGSTTITSMLSGVVNGLISEIRGFIITYEKQYPNLKIVITGGDANFFEKELKNGIFADPNLVLKGLNEILIYNGK